MAEEMGKILDEKALEDVTGGYQEITELTMICSNCKTMTKWTRDPLGAWRCGCGCYENWTVYQYNDWLKSQGK